MASSRHRRHLLELVQLSLGLGQCILGQAGGIDALFQLFDFVVAFVTIAQLFLNGLHLLIQVVLALAALHLFLDATANALLDLQQIDFAVEQCQHVFDTGRQINDFENFLLLLDLEGHMGRHRIDQSPRLIDAVKRRQDLCRHLRPVARIVRTATAGCGQTPLTHARAHRPLRSTTPRPGNGRPLR